MSKKLTIELTCEYGKFNKEFEVLKTFPSGDLLLTSNDGIVMYGVMNGTEEIKVSHPVEVERAGKFTTIKILKQ